MYKFRMAIIEDNVYEQQMLCDQLEEVIKGCKLDWYSSGEAFLEAKQRYDIIFIDYEMPGMNGVETADIYRRKWPKTAIVFVSGHEEMLPQGYKVRAHQFLVKPVTKEELEEVIRRISEERRLQALCLEWNGQKDVIPIKSIVYIESGKHGNGVVIRTKEKEYRDYQPLSFYEEYLSSEYFVQVHRSYIVNLYYVEEYHRNLILLKNGEKAKLSLRRQKYFEEKLNEFKWKMGKT